MSNPMIESLVYRLRNEYLNIHNIKPMTEKNYAAYLQEVARFIPKERIYTDELRRLAWGTDAGFYRLIPQIIVRSEGEDEVARLLKLADQYKLPVTFRAAGTSLSGQSVSDSILIVAGKNWEKYSLSADAKTIRLQPGIVGQRVNDILAPYKRKFSPDPASVKSAMVGGIVMNNASGMNCGTHANSDRTLISARIILTDGTILDTGDEKSKEAFRQSHPQFLNEICRLRDEVRANEKLTERIKYKYSIKNVTGLNILPFALFDDPFDIITHIMVGSEGTLAFLSEVTMQTEHDYPCKASAMLYFKTIKEACEAVVDLKNLAYRVVKGAEMLDYKSLSSVSDPVFLRFTEEIAAGKHPGRKPGDEKGLTAVLVETKADSQEELNSHIKEITACLQKYETYTPVYFADKPEEYGPYWAIRSGIFPSVGGTRQPGTTCLIEDIAFHIENLPEATAELQELIARHGYDDACIYGHALEGNYHFIINQNFRTDAEVKRYADLMEDVKHLVVDRYDGSLKAEHGTGRNMAPFVKYEWGEDAFNLMKAVKHLFDPNGLLNPGVIFNDDPECHIKNFKPLPLLGQDKQNDKEAAEVYAKTNRCIECGFCEVNCVSCGLTISSRQRIVIQRELSRLKQSGQDPERVALLTKQYQYLGNETCAGDGLCSMSCPMGINTADLTHLIRQEQLPPHSTGYKVGKYAADHFAGIKNGLRPVLGLANMAHSVLGTSLMTSLTRGMHNTLGIPLWTPSMPKSYKYDGPAVVPAPGMPKDEKKRVVYFPSCINQTMGLPKKSKEEQALVNKMISLLNKAGFEVIFPQHMERLCCGTIWESKGMMDIADEKVRELEEALWIASEQGKIPVLCDQSPCLHRMRKCIKKMKLYEPAEFIYDVLRPHLEFKQIDRPVALHITCSTREMGLGNKLIALAKLCSTQVFVPEEVGCCGFAGDRGFTHPELNSYALRKLRPQIEAHNIKHGYSNSRTCEIGLTTNSGIPYVSIVYLVDECTK